ncbi:MAG: hypothetical protein RIS81_860 [Actinomycetota bacterium]
MPVTPLLAKLTLLTNFGFLMLLMSTMSIVFFAPLVMKRRLLFASIAEISAPARPMPLSKRATNFRCVLPGSAETTGGLCDLAEIGEAEMLANSGNTMNGTVSKYLGFVMALKINCADDN